MHFRADLACDIALDATYTVMLEDRGRKEIDIKRYAKVEKVGLLVELMNQCMLTNYCSFSQVPGGSIEDSQVLKGVMVNKDIVHPKMRR